MAKQDAVTEAAAPTRLDLKQEYKYLYQAQAKQAALIDVPPLSYLMIDGQGNPNTSQSYQDALGALYKLAYALKFMVKKTLGIEYPVMALEGCLVLDDDDYAAAMRHTRVGARGRGASAEEEGDDRPREDTAGGPARGALGADHAPWSLRDRGADYRAAARLYS